MSWSCLRRIATRLVPILIVSLLVAGQANACAVCLKGITITPGQKLDAATDVVLVLPLDDSERFQVIEVIKGDGVVGTIVSQSDLVAASIEMSLDGPLKDQDVPRTVGTMPLLLIRDKASREWASLGAIDANYAEWLRRLVATYSVERGRSVASSSGLAALVASGSAGVDWNARLLLVADEFESSSPLVAEIAYGELARSPYAAISSLSTKLETEKIVGWINDPNLVARRPGYTLLMGLAGGRAESDQLEKHIAAALDTRASTDLAAMLTADIELRGPSRVEWIEKTFFDDRRRTLPEIEAALQALSVHGQADTSISRARVVQSYHHFIRARRPMAGFVAMELADWGEWGFAAEYADILRTKSVKDPAGEFAILSYLRQNPAQSSMASQNDQPN